MKKNNLFAYNYYFYFFDELFNSNLEYEMDEKWDKETINTIMEKYLETYEETDEKEINPFSKLLALAPHVYSAAFAFFKRYSLFSISTISISAPAKSIPDDSKLKFANSVLIMASETFVPFIKTS